MFYTKKATVEDLKVLLSVSNQVKQAGVEVHFKRLTSGMFALLIKKPTNSKGEYLLTGTTLNADLILGLI